MGSGVDMRMGIRNRGVGRQVAIVPCEAAEPSRRLPRKRNGGGEGVSSRTVGDPIDVVVSRQIRSQLTNFIAFVIGRRRDGPSVISLRLRLVRPAGSAY